MLRRLRAIQGVQGVMVKKDQRLKFIVTLELIGQHAESKVNSSELENFSS